MKRCAFYELYSAREWRSMYTDKHRAACAFHTTCHDKKQSKLISQQRPGAEQCEKHLNWSYHNLTAECTVDSAARLNSFMTQLRSSSVLSRILPWWANMYVISWSVIEISIFLAILPSDKINVLVRPGVMLSRTAAMLCVCNRQKQNLWWVSWMIELDCDNNRDAFADQMIWSIDIDFVLHRRKQCVSTFRVPSVKFHWLSVLACQTRCASLSSMCCHSRLHKNHCLCLALCKQMRMLQRVYHLMLDRSETTRSASLAMARRVAL